MMKRYIIIWMVIAILCVLYGSCIKRIGSGTRFYLVWFALAVLAFGCALGVHFQLWGRIPEMPKKGMAVLGISVIVLFVWIEGCIVSAFGQEGNPKLDYVIVLGAQMRADGPSRVLRYRLDEAVAYLKDHPDTICIVSGGKGANEPCSEAAGMKTYLIEKGISKDQILEEDRSLNTVQNMKYSAAFLDDKEADVGIITNNFHVFRAVRLAKKQGISNVYGISAPSSAFYLPNNLLREFFGVLKDFVMGNL